MLFLQGLKPEVVLQAVENTTYHTLASACHQIKWLLQRQKPEAVLQALESIHREKYGGGGSATQFEDEVVPPLLRRSIAVYEAARCLIGYITPHYDEISKVQSTMHPVRT